MPRGTKTTWIPRSSSFGAYLACDQRAAFDRAIHEGLLPEPVREPAPYADFGTVSHYALQTSTGCVFPDGNHEPTGEQRATAATLFNGDLAAMDAQVQRTARLAAEHMPATPDGRPWLAESAFKTTAVSGHIDFLSPCFKVIGDLKTTSRKPDHNRPKAEHIWQLLCYRQLVLYHKGVAADKAWILYVDSLKAQWAMIHWIDFAAPAMTEMIEFWMRYAKYLRSADLYKRAIPRFGSTCASTFCPHVAACRDRYLPAAAPVLEASPEATLGPATSFFRK